MDLNRLDAVARSLAGAGSRRKLLGLLAGIPAAAGLLDLLSPDDTEAKERRRRRKQRHKKRRNPGNRKKGCKPASRAKVCTGRCGPVQSRQTCGKTVDCGSCDCNPACEDCFICQGNTGAPGTCVPQEAGTLCGTEAICENGTLQPQGSCDGFGVCEPASPVSCAPYIGCDGNACATSCSDDSECVAESFCESGQCVGDRDNGEQCDHGGQCISGHCVEHLCCNTDCAGECLACDLAGTKGICTPLTGTACGEPGQVCQDDGTCACEAGSCASGQRCLGTTCACDSVSCPGGCCDAGICHIDVDAACGSNGGVCQTCTAPATCGGGGAPGVCGCTPDCTGKPCGASDGCGGTCASGSCAACQACSGGTCIPDASHDGTCCDGASGGKQCLSGACVAEATLEQCQSACTYPLYSFFPKVSICGQAAPCPACTTCPDSSDGCVGPLGNTAYCVQAQAGTSCNPGMCPDGQICCSPVCRVPQT